MRLLLDTHILLWWVAGSPNLSDEATSLVANPENPVYVSAVSHWEMRLKLSIGKLRLPANLSAVLKQGAFEELPLTAKQTEAAAKLPWLHRDPFDRMLIAQAMTERMTLLTADERLPAYGSCVRLVK